MAIEAGAHDADMAYRDDIDATVTASVDLRRRSDRFRCRRHRGRRSRPPPETRIAADGLAAATHATHQPSPPVPTELCARRRPRQGLDGAVLGPHRTGRRSGDAAAAWRRLRSPSPPSRPGLAGTDTTVMYRWAGAGGGLAWRRRRGIA